MGAYKSDFSYYLLFKRGDLIALGISKPARASRWFMHDGRFASLNEVLDFYSTGIQNHPKLHGDLQTNGQPKRMNFSANDKSDLIAFLNTLTDNRLLEDKKFSDHFKQ